MRLPAAARLPRPRWRWSWAAPSATSSTALRLGYVVDFVHVYWREHQWPDFNVADSAITVGVALLVLDILRSPETRAAAGAQIDTAEHRREDRLDVSHAC